MVFSQCIACHCIVAPNIRISLVNCWFGAGHGHEHSSEAMQIQQVFSEAGRMWTGIFAIGFLLQAFLMLVLGRWLQAKLYNPNGLQTELHNIRLSMTSVLVFMLIAICAKLQVTAMFDLLLITSFIFSLAGLSLLHYIASRVMNPKLFLIGVYFMIIFFAKLAFILLALLAVTDALFDLRSKFLKKGVV